MIATTITAIARMIPSSCAIFASWRQVDEPEVREANREGCVSYVTLRRLSKKCNVAKKNPWNWRLFGSGSCRERKNPQPLDGQGKLAERNETSSSALPALQHLLGGLRAEHPLVALPTFWVLFIQKFARRAKAPKLLIYFEPGARNRRPTTDVGALKMREVLCLMSLTA